MKTIRIIFIASLMLYAVNALPEITGTCNSGNCVNGYGSITYSDGSAYTGQFKNGIEHGKGTCTWPSGDTYTGQLKESVIEGYGTFTWSYGKKYTGYFKNNKAEGKGTLFYPSGAKYTGQFKNNKQHGEGTFTWADGSKYVGQYKNNKKNGQGTLYDEKGKILYKGLWKDGEPVNTQNNKLIDSESKEVSEKLKELSDEFDDFFPE